MSTIQSGSPGGVGRPATRRELLRPAWLGGLTALAAALVVSGAYLAADGPERPPDSDRAVIGTPSPATAPPPTAARSTPSARSPDVSAPPTPIDYWPGPDSTGVPAGTTLHNQTGTLNLRKAGQVITGLDLTGCVNVYASNVQILRSRITCNSTTFAVRVMNGASGLMLQDVEINGRGGTAVAVCCSDFTLDRANIYNTIDGARLGNNTRVLNSYLHDLARLPGTHNDSLQTTGGSRILVQHNRIETYNPQLQDPFNSCLMVGSETAPALTDLLFTDNYCNGGNYSIGIRSDLVASDVRFIKNKYGRDYRYGVIARPSQPGICFERSTNVWFDNGQPVLP